VGEGDKESDDRYHAAVRFTPLLSMDMSYSKDPHYIFKKLRSSYKYLCSLLREVDGFSLDDEQREMRAIVIATQLRTLLYDSKNAKSILSQLGIKDHLFFMPTCADGQIDIAANLVPSYLLVSCQVSERGLCVRYCRPDRFKHNLNVFFDYWWNEIVIDTKGDSPKRLSRQQIVLTLCDKEGGAHLDPQFTDEYYAVNYCFGYELVRDNGEVCELKNNVFAETTIAIAYELLDAISVYFYNVQNKSSIIEDTPHTIISISYPNGRGGYNKRLFLNARGCLYTASRLAFDYYHKASYSICQLRGYKYIREDKSFFSFLTVDEKTEKQMIVLRDDDSNTYEVLLEVSKDRYSLVNHDNDIISSEGKALQQIIKELSNGDPNCFDKYLSLQNK